MSATSRPFIALVTGLALVGAGAVAFVGLTGEKTTEVADQPRAASWAPAPRLAGGVSVVATAGNGRYALHTKHGDVPFLAGVNLGATTPGHQPGELAITAAQYRRWFVEMGEVGFRSVRIYTIHPPAFYSELARYNRLHPRAPLYLIQGVYLPDETYNENRVACTTPTSTERSAARSSTP